MKPAVGRIIHVLHGKDWLAAIITGIWGRDTSRPGALDCTVFPPGNNLPFPRSGLPREPGEVWRWPPRPEIGIDAP